MRDGFLVCWKASLVQKIASLTFSESHGILTALRMVTAFIHRSIATFLLGIFIAGAAFVHAEEQSSTVTVVIDNAPPQVTSLGLSSVAYGNPEFAGGITPSVGTTTFHITVVLLDPNASP